MLNLPWFFKTQLTDVCGNTFKWLSVIPPRVKQGMFFMSSPYEFSSSKNSGSVFFKRLKLETNLGTWNSNLEHWNLIKNTNKISSADIKQNRFTSRWVTLTVACHWLALALACRCLENKQNPGRIGQLGCAWICLDTSTIQPYSESNFLQLWTSSKYGSMDVSIDEHTVM